MMKFLLALILVALTSCQQSPTEFSPGALFSSCSTVEVPGGHLLQCPGIQDIPVMDGADGQDGTDGENGIDGQDAVVEVIAPCNDPYNEVLIRMSDGTVIGHYSGGTVNKQALVVLTPGAYVTTGRGTTCRFNVDADGNVTW